MQRFRVLKTRAADAPLLRAFLESDQVLGMASSGLLPGVVAYLIPAQDLEDLAHALPEGVVQDRGVKHPSKALAGYFARRNGVVRLRADYRQAGQAARGVRALLSALGPLETRGHCLIGIPQAVFEELWNRSADSAGNATRLGRGGDATPPAVTELLSLHPELRIPRSVSTSYIGSAPEVRLVHFLIVLAANCEFPVLIEGETGTGKEIVARQIHALRYGVNGKCVSVNCGGIPTELLESELFGHVQGAFTSATRSKTGLWKDAENGTLFLDEIGDLSPRHQVKLLRAMEDGAFLPVGGVKPVRSNARVLSATHQNLDAMVRAGRFREDLYHRLVVLRIRTPSLREHPEDIPAIAAHLWPGIRLRKEQHLGEDIGALLREQAFPGNVRELRSVLSELAMLSYGKPISPRMVRLVLRDRRAAPRDE